MVQGVYDITDCIKHEGFEQFYDMAVKENFATFNFVAVYSIRKRFYYKENCTEGLQGLY